MHLLHLRLHAWTSGAVLPLRDLAVPEQSCLSTKGRREPRHPSLLFRAPHPGMAACMHHRSLSCCVIMYRRTWHPSEWMLLKKRASVYAVLGVPCLCCYCLSFFPNRLLFPLLGKFNSSPAASCTPPCPSSGRSPGYLAVTEGRTAWQPWGPFQHLHHWREVTSCSALLGPPPAPRRAAVKCAKHTSL